MRVSLEAPTSNSNPLGSAGIQAPSASMVFNVFSPEVGLSNGKGKQNFKDQLKSRGKLITKENSINSVNADTGIGADTSSNLSRIANAQRVTGDLTIRLEPF